MISFNEIVEIKHRNSVAKINISCGANCISLRMGKYSLLREPDYTKGLDNPYLYGMPILFPVNRISNGKFVFEERSYIFPINEPETSCHLHGKIHNSGFEVTAKEESKVICTYTPDPDDPYVKAGNDYKIEIEYMLNDEGFYQCVSVINLSDNNMPVLLGFHTTFNTLFANGKPNDTYVYAEIAEEYERNMSNYLPTGRVLRFDDVSKAILTGKFKPFDTPISRHYKAAYSGKMVIYDGHNNLSMVYENDEKYMYRLIFNCGEYICLEPQTCVVNCPNAPFDKENSGFNFLKPGEIKKYYSKICVCEGDMR